MFNSKFYNACPRAVQSGGVSLYLRSASVDSQGTRIVICYHSYDTRLASTTAVENAWLVWVWMPKI